MYLLFVVTTVAFFFRADNATALVRGLFGCSCM